MADPSPEEIDRLAALLAAYGADPARWPRGREEAARALLEQSAEARAMAAQEVLLDEWLAEARPGPVPAPLLGRVLAAARRRERPGLLERWLWQPAAGLALAALLGVALGSLTSPFSPEGPLLAWAENDVVVLDSALTAEGEL